MIDVPYCRWTAPETVLTIEYSSVVMEQLRAYVADGFQRVLQGGVEVGGVLLGMREGNVVRIEAMEKVPIEYASGPSFTLTGGDKAAFAAALRGRASSGGLPLLMPVGWFVSHTRFETVCMTEADAAVFDEFFPEPWQFTLVFKPARMGLARAGFFVRDPDGTVRLGQSYREFDLEPAASLLWPVIAPEEPEPRQNTTALVVSSSGASVAAVAVPERVPLEAFAPHHHPYPSKRWLWIAAGLMFAAVAIALIYFFWWRSAAPPLDLSVTERGTELIIEWSSAALARATHATIDVSEGGTSHAFHLGSGQMAKGELATPFKTGEVSVRITTYDRRGVMLAQESARYVGQPPPAVIQQSEELTAARRRAAELQSENDGLRKTIAEQSASMGALRQRLRALEKRAAIQPGRGKPRSGTATRSTRRQ